jgi:hypothetical protein
MSKFIDEQTKCVNTYKTEFIIYAICQLTEHDLLFLNNMI